MAWLAIAFVLGAFLYGVRGILLPFVVGILMAYFLDPAADRLERAGLGRNSACGIIIVGFFLLFVTVAALLAPLLLNQLEELVSAIPAYAAELQAHYGATFRHWLDQVEGGQGDTIKNAAGAFAKDALLMGGAVAAALFRSGTALINIISLVLITPLVAFYLLRDWDFLVARLDALLPRKHADTIREQLAAIDATLAGFLRGQINVCLLMAVYYGALLPLAGVPFGLAIGILTGLLVVLPYIGFFLGCATGLGVAFAQFGLEVEFWLAASVFAGGQVIESYFLTPKLVGNRVGLHPLWIVFGMLAGAALLGFVGVLLAVPLTAVVGVLIRFAIGRYLESPLYLEQ